MKEKRRERRRKKKEEREERKEKKREREKTIGAIFLPWRIVNAIEDLTVGTSAASEDKAADNQASAEKLGSVNFETLYLSQLNCNLSRMIGDQLSEVWST